MKIGITLFLVSQLISLGWGVYNFGYNHGKAEHEPKGRVESTEILYMKMLKEDTDNASLVEKAYLNYLEGIYK